MSVNRIIALSITLLFLAACNRKEKTSEEIMKGWKAFDTEEYMIKHPASWLVNESGFMGTSFLIISKQTSIRDFYQENVRLIEKDVDSTQTLEAFVEASQTAIQDTVMGFALLKDTLFTFNKVPCRWMIYEGQEGLNKVTTETYYFLKDAVGYELTFSGKSMEMGRYQTIGETMMNSFTIK